MKLRTSPFMTAAIAEKAVSMALPAILAMMESGQMKRKALHIVVINPLAIPSQSTFEDAILYEYSIGDRQRWEHDYYGIARSKAEISWVNAWSNRQVRNMPWLLAPGNTKYIGSAVSEDGGLIVVASGVQDYYDEMSAKMVLAALQAVAIETEQLARASDHDDYYR